MIRSYRESREKYRPRGIRVLFIAESPPSSGGYFYFERPASHLFRETMKALRFYPEWERMPRDLDKRPYLKRFQAEGYFLIDTCKSPIDKRARKDRARAIVEGAKRIPSEVRELDPEKIVIVKKTVYGPVREALDKAGLAERILNDEPLPFPSHGNQPKYREGLRRLLGVVLRARIEAMG